jgi:hypothetical protein
MPKPISPVLSNEDAQKYEVAFAKDQPQYTQLPAVYRRYETVEGMVTTRWKFSLIERLHILIGGSIWLQLLTFHSPLQPIKIHTLEPKEF